MGKDLIKEKGIFVVGLMAAFLAFSAYKEELSSIRIQMGAHMAPTLSSLFLVFVIFLALSVYFYALDYLKYSYPRFQNSFIFKVTAFLGNFFYSLGIIFPLLVLVSWIASGIPPTPPKYQAWLIIFDTVGVILISIGAAANAIYQMMRGRNQAIENIDRTKLLSLGRALQLLDNGFYREVIVESFRVLEFFLRERLLREGGLYTQGMPVSVLIEFAKKRDVLDERITSQVMDLRALRNQAVHSDQSFNKEQATFAIDTIRSILEKPEAK